MNKVCHITSVHMRYDVRIFKKECSSLAKSGYPVTLIVNDDKPNEIINNVNIISTGYIPKNRVQRIIVSNRRMYKIALKQSADLYHFHDPELLPLGKKLKRQGKKVIFDSHEDVSKQILEKNWIPKCIRTFISTLYRKYERNVVRKFDAVISVSPQIVNRFASYNKAVMITNYPIIELEHEPHRKPENYIGFAGGINSTWCHDKIIQAINKIEGIKYLTAGISDNKYLNYLKTLDGWNRVEYLGLITHEDVEKLYQKTLIGVALNYSIQVKGIGTLGNTKLFEFMQHKIPVVCTDYKLWKEIIDKYKCGICINPLDVNEIESAIRYLLENPEEALEMGERGYAAFKKYYNWSSEEKKLYDLYEQVLN